MTSERREVWYRIPERDFFDIVCLGTYFWFHIHYENDGNHIRLPPGAKAKRFWRDDPISRCFRVIFEHPSFDPVPDGVEAPYGGLLVVTGSQHPDTAHLSKELEAAYAVIHDLTQQLKELGHEPGR